MSIIIPTLNEHLQVRELIPYLQSHLDNEESQIIVADALDSKDEMKQFCLEQDVFYVRCSKTQRASQMNQGAMIASNANLFFLHADVVPPRNFDKIISKALIKFDCGIFAYRFDKFHPLASINAYFTKYNSCFSGGGDQGLFIKKSVFLKLGKYDGSYDVMEDFAFFKKIREQGVRYKIVSDRATVSLRKYSAQSYWKINWINLQMIRAFRRNESPEVLNSKYHSYKLKRV